MENREGFSYTYKASEQQEIESIRRQYLPKDEDKMDQLRRLHRGVAKKAQARAITLGTIGVLVLGTGMSLLMTDLGKVFWESGLPALIVGMALGIFGIVLVALAYPVYMSTLKQEKERIAPEILRLTDELLK